MSRRARAAIAYARMGWRVLPIWHVRDGRCLCERSNCMSPGKHPVHHLARHGVHDATRDERTLHRWWAEYPEANVGLATGAASGFVVLDVDPLHGGDETLRDLERAHGPLPRTVESLTGSGGRHVLFRHPGGAARVPNRVALAPGLDVRGDGGYVVAPPSVHVSGREYVWEVTSRPDEVPLAPVPDWLLRRLTPQRGAANGQSSRVSEALNSRPLPGERTAAFVVLMGYLARRVPPDVGLAIARCWNAALPVPWDDEELEKRARSFYQYGDAMTASDAEVQLAEVLAL